MEDINLQDWVGKTEEIEDRVYTTPARALALTLNYKDFEAREGNPLPEIWYWLYFLPIVPMSEVGPDGHPKRGGFLPPITLERRMWASGNLTFHQDLIIGEEIRKTSEDPKNIGKRRQSRKIGICHRKASDSIGKGSRGGRRTKSSLSPHAQVICRT